MLQVMTEFYLNLHYVMGITAVWRARSSWECPARSNQCGLDQDPGLNGCPMINSHLACRSAKLVCEPTCPLGQKPGSLPLHQVWGI